MSITAWYHSFSPSRADAGWITHGEKDVKDIREMFNRAGKYQLANELRHKVTSGVKAKYEIEQIAFRQKIFNDFESRGLYIPKHDWTADDQEDMMEYLANYGCVYEKGVIPPKDGARYEMLPKSVRDQYYFVEQKMRDEIEEEIKSGQIEIKSKFAGLPEEPQDKNEIVQELRTLDRGYGSVVASNFEEPKLEYLHLDTLCKVYGLEKVDGVPPKSQWIKLFATLNGEKTKLVAAALAQESGQDVDLELKRTIEYLNTIHPVVEDLKKTDDAIFYREYDVSSEGEPRAVSEQLDERAIKHFEQYKDQLPPTN